MFQNDQRQFYRKLNHEGERCDDDQPDAEKSKKFWGNIWCELLDHNRNAKWLKDLQSEVAEEKVYIIKQSFKKIFGRMEVTRSRLSPGVLGKEF